jgi:hypothetical protein
MERRNASGRLSIHLSDDGSTFDIYASRLKAYCGAQLVEQLDGLDQRYWDFKVAGAIMVLHVDHFMGVWLQAGEDLHDDDLRHVASQILRSDSQA